MTLLQYITDDHLGNIVLFSPKQNTTRQFFLMPARPKVGTPFDYYWPCEKALQGDFAEKYCQILEEIMLEEVTKSACKELSKKESAQ